jgi:iron complex transport system substrate-binding protein
LPADLPEGRGVVVENADGTRTVTSAWGSVTVPTDPQRVVSVIGDIDFEAMLALGMRPVGAGTQGGTVESGFAPHLAGLTEGIEPLAWVDGVPFEAVAALEPDLIFAYDEDSARTLQRIAPTVPRGSWIGTQWKEDFRYVATVLGRSDDAERLLAAHEARAAALKERLAPLGGGWTVASPQVTFDHTQVLVDPGDAFSSAVLTELGFNLPPMVANAREEGVPLSFERLDELDADALFWQVRQDNSGQPDIAGLDVARNSPLWSQIPAVQAGRVFLVDNRPWYFPTILGARTALDDVEAALLP